MCDFKDKFGASFITARNLMKTHLGAHTNDDYDALMLDVSRIKPQLGLEAFESGLVVAVLNELERLCLQGRSVDIKPESFDSEYLGIFAWVYKFSRIYYCYDLTPSGAKEALIREITHAKSNTEFFSDLAKVCYDYIIKPTLCRATTAA